LAVLPNPTWFMGFGGYGGADPGFGALGLLLGGIAPGYGTVGADYNPGWSSSTGASAPCAACSDSPYVTGDFNQQYWPNVPVEGLAQMAYHPLGLQPSDAATIQLALGHGMGAFPLGNILDYADLLTDEELMDAVNEYSASASDLFPNSNSFGVKPYQEDNNIGGTLFGDDWELGVKNWLMRLISEDSGEFSVTPAVAAEAIALYGGAMYLLYTSQTVPTVLLSPLPPTTGTQFNGSPLQPGCGGFTFGCPGK